MPTLTPSTNMPKSAKTSPPTSPNSPPVQPHYTRQHSFDVYPSPTHFAGKLVADFYQWPVFFAILPPILTLYYGGKIEEWSEGFMLFVVAFYLYGLIKLPWELYVGARLNHQQLNRVAAAYAAGTLDERHAAEQMRQSSASKLWLLEWLYFILVFVSPLGGATFLRHIRPHLHVYQNLINDFPMALYVLTSYIRPLIHLSRLLKQASSALRDEVEYPVLEIQQLRRKVDRLERKLDELVLLTSSSSMEASKQFHESVEPHIKGITNNLKKTVQKEQKFIEFSLDRFRELDARLQEQAVYVARQQNVIEKLQHGRLAILSPVYWAYDAAQTFGHVMMMPIHVAVKVATWWVPGSVKQLVFQRLEWRTKRPSITDSSTSVVGAGHQQLSGQPSMYSATYSGGSGSQMFHKRSGYGGGGEEFFSPDNDD